MSMSATLFDLFLTSLEDAMQKNGISQLELARRSGVHPVYINRIIKRHQTNPTVDVVEKLLAAAGGNTKLLHKKIS